MGANITQDSKAGWFFPQSAAEWTRMLAGMSLANPDSAVACQDEGSGLVDIIDGLQPWANASGGTVYRASVAGFNRYAVSNGPEAGPGLNATGAFSVDTLANPTNKSVTALLVAEVPPDNDVTERTLMFAGGCYVNVALTPTSVRLRVYTDNLVTPTTSVYNRAGRGPLVILARVNFTKQTAVFFVRDNGERGDLFKPEVLRPAGYTINTSQMLFLGGTGYLAPPDNRILYGAFWTGVGAEFTDEQCDEICRRVIHGPPLTAVGDDTYKPRARGRASVLLQMNEIDQALRPVDSIGGIHQLALAANALDTQLAAQRTLGWGKWNHCWSLNDSSSVTVVPSWGPYHLNLSGATAARLPRPRQRGMRLDDYAYSQLASDNYSTGLRLDYDTAGLDVGAADDLAILLAIPRSGTLGSATYFAIKSGFVGGPDWYVAGTPGTLYFRVDDGPDAVEATVSAPAGDVPYVIGAVMGRGTNKLRLGRCVIGQAPVVSAELDVSAIGSLVNPGTFMLGHGNQAWESALTVGQLMMCVGASTADGVSANLSTILERYAAAVSAEPLLVDAAVSRGRSFVAMSRNAYESIDVQAGDTLHTRDMSVQAIVKWNIEGQGQAADHMMVKTGGNDIAFDAGASSMETIVGDGYLEFRADDSNFDGRCIGLSESDPDQVFNSIRHMLAFESSSIVNFWESGGMLSAHTHAPGDVFRLERVGTSIHFKKNGVILATDATAATGPLMIDSSLKRVGSGFRHIRLVQGGVPKAITWQNVINVTMSLTANTAGTLYARGDSSESSHLSGAVELRPLSSKYSVGEIGWVWRASDGKLRRQLGGQFVSPSGYIMVTATRRWYSPTRVVLSYYVGDQLVGEVETTDGDISGSTSAPTFIGGRRVGGYPSTAAAMEAATFPGSKWVAGYRANVASGDIAPMFGSLGNAVAQSTPTYGHIGPRRAIDPTDSGVGFNSNADAYQLGDNLDVAVNEDFAFAWVGYHDAYPLNVIMNKFEGGGAANGYYLTGDGVNTFYWRTQNAAVLDLDVFITRLPIRRPYVGICVIDRGTGKGRLAVCDADGTVELSAEDAIANAIANTQPLCIGASPWLVGSTNTRMYAWWFAHGVAACSGMSANLGFVARNLAATVFGTYGEFFDGTIDELRVVDRALTHEEVEATWRRITRWQPDAEQLVLDCVPPGWPVDLSTNTDAGKEARLVGQGLGHAAADIEVMREYTLPDRAFGDTLEQWERAARQSPRAFDDEAKRRKRIIGHVRQRAGVSDEGVRAALTDLVATDTDNLEVLGYSQEQVDRFERIDAWQAYPLYYVRKVGGVFGYDSSADSFQVLEGDGWIEWIVHSTAQTSFIGLTAATEAYSVDPNNIDYAIRWDVTDYSAYENGAQLQFATGMVANDVLRIERRGSTITWSRNGTVYYTKTGASTAPMRVVVCMATVNGGVLHLQLMNIARDGLHTLTGLDWRLTGNMTLSIPPYSMPYNDARLRKNGGGAAWDAGASSVETVAGDGRVEITIQILASDQMIGFSANDANVDFATIQHALYHNAANLRVYESGVLKAGPIALAVGDVLCVRRVGSLVTYERNGAVIYASEVASTGPLRVDSSLFNAPSRFDMIKLYDGDKRSSLTWQNAVNVIAVSDFVRMQHNVGVSAPVVDYQGKWDPGWTTFQQGISTMPLVRYLDTGRVAEGFGAVLSAQVSPVSIPVDYEVGIAFYDLPRKNALLFGIRNEAGVYKLVSEMFTDGASSGVIYHANTTLTRHWLRMRGIAPRPLQLVGNEADWLPVEDGDNFVDLEWSTTGMLAGFSVARFREAPSRYNRALVYARTTSYAATLATASDVYFDDVRLFTPYGDHPFRFHVYRDKSLPGAYDLAGANQVIQRLKHAHTQASVVTSKRLLAGDPESGCGLGPCGG